MSRLRFHRVEICMFYPQLRLISAMRYVCKQNIMSNSYLNNDALLMTSKLYFLVSIEYSKILHI